MTDTDVQAVDEVAKAEMKTEDGRQYPAEAFAYVPDPDKPSTWKLRLWSPEPGERETIPQIGAAVAALGPGGYRGNRVQVPASDLPGVKRRVLEAWLRVHPDKDRGDAPPVLLSSRPMVRTSADEVANAGYGWEDERKDHDYGDVAAGADAMTHLLIAYRQLIDHPECEPLLAPVMEIVHQLQEMLTDAAEIEVDLVDPEMTDDAFGKEIRYEDGQYCVYSETGRGFGCYPSEDQAKNRLAQIEQFSGARVDNAATADLVAWHDRLHLLDAPTEAHVAVHDLIEDILERRLDTTAPVLAMAVGVSGLPLAKQAEQRYTLGPVYVPGMEDAHGEFTDEETLQKALWGWVRKEDRTIYLQHSDKAAGEMVEVLTWPFEVTADLSVPGEGVTKYTFPADTPFMGVVWEPWAWELVKAGELRGYSIGGRARRMEADLPVDALIG